jgi:hypothetical protein
VYDRGLDQRHLPAVAAEGAGDERAAGARATRSVAEGVDAPFACTEPSSAVAENWPLVRYVPLSSMLCAVDIAPDHVHELARPIDAVSPSPETRA